MNKGMCSGRHRHEYPITIYFCIILLFIYRQTERNTFSIGGISLVVA